MLMLKHLQGILVSQSMNERTQELSSLTNITGLYQLKKFSNIGYQTALAWFNQGANYMPKFTAGAYGYPTPAGK
ncbi:hypothetical protein EB796_006133 [Bugula neritina]|uniref:Uncharacterized protein n=1 Tax=Bugula neritina TaxID=10212 RepID=A0A7J7KBI7_BUGNE|nr:hypothetical protein EB796_006133 [Bugula neritina]